MCKNTVSLVSLISLVGTAGNLVVFAEDKVISGNEKEGKNEDFSENTKKTENKKESNKKKDYDSALAEKVGRDVGIFWSFSPVSALQIVVSTFALAVYPFTFLDPKWLPLATSVGISVFAIALHAAMKFVGAISARVARGSLKSFKKDSPKI